MDGDSVPENSVPDRPRRSAAAQAHDRILAQAVSDSTD